MVVQGSGHSAWYTVCTMPATQWTLHQWQDRSNTIIVPRTPEVLPAHFGPRVQRGKHLLSAPMDSNELTFVEPPRKHLGTSRSMTLGPPCQRLTLSPDSEPPLKEIW